MLEPVLEAWQGVRRRGHGPQSRGRGRPRKRFEKFHADKAYDNKRCRRAVSAGGMKVRIARKGVESKEKLGTHRWKVERTMSWFDGFRRLRIRDERSVLTFRALHVLAAVQMCFRELQKAA